MAFSKGSIWNRWDLHTHTPASFEQNFRFDSEEEHEAYDGNIWEKYIDQLSDVEDVPCLGITDYFSIDGYEQVRKAKDEGRLDNLELVVPNVELRIDNVVVERGEDNENGASSSINLHVIFSDELSPQTIKQNFFHQIRAEKPDGSSITLTHENIERLGSQGGIEHLDVRSGSPFRVGCERLNVVKESVYEALEQEIFSGRHLILLDEATWNSIPWKTRAGTVRANLASRADALFSSNIKTRDFFLGKLSDNTPDEVIDTFGSLKPCVHGSDAHAFSTLCKPDKNRYCWIKADTTFEGLKQIKYEPADRVRIQEENPRGHLPGYTPKSVTIRDGTIKNILTVTDTDLSLNPNLVTVIGGKGAGKTALLDLIANCFEDRCRRDDNEPIDENSFIQRIEGEEPEILTHLEFCGEGIDGFSKCVKDTDIIEAAQLEYLPQGKISEYCRQKEKLHSQIIELIKSSVRKSDRDLMDRFESKYNAIAQCENELDQLTRDLYEYDPETLDGRITEARQAARTTEAELQDKTTEIEQFREQYQDELQNNSATELQSEIDGLNNEIESLKTLRNNVDNAIVSLDELDSVNEQLAKISETAEAHSIDRSLSPIKHGEQLRTLEKIQEEVSEHSNTKQDQKQKVQNELNSLSDSEEQLSELLTEKRDIESDLEGRKEQLTSLRRDQDLVSKLRRDRREAFKQYVGEYTHLENLYELVIGEFNSNQVTILDDIDFSPMIAPDEQLSERFHDRLDGRKVNLQRIRPAIMSLREALNHDTPKRDELIDDFLDEIGELKQHLTSNVSARDFDETLYDSHLSLTEEIYFQGTKMGGLSLGQKGTVLLKILLAEGTTPLIIDQPEENLDNRFIYETLRDTFREAKQQRQVIIATHNANLVVNTDAEQVIVANYDENEIQFTAGSLENPLIRDEVTTLLEGGKRAFRQREQKYGFND